MFCRQVGALLTKNFILKRRLWKQTIFEILMPLLCGLIAGFISYTPTTTNPVEYFNEISMVYLLTLTLITISFAGSCTFILN